MLKIGDICEVIDGLCLTFNDSDGKYVKILSVITNGNLFYEILDKEKNVIGQCGICLKEKDLKLITTKKTPLTYTIMQEWSDNVTITEDLITIDEIDYTPKELREEIKKLRAIEERHRKFTKRLI